MSARRPLTSDENRILTLLQDAYGPANALDEVFFTDRGEACIFVRDLHGTLGMIVNLTVVPVIQRAEGVSDDRVFERYLCPPETNSDARL